MAVAAFSIHFSPPPQPGSDETKANDRSGANEEGGTTPGGRAASSSERALWFPAFMAPILAHGAAQGYRGMKSDTVFSPRGR